MYNFCRYNDEDTFANSTPQKFLWIFDGYQEPKVLEVLRWSTNPKDLVINNMKNRNKYIQPPMKFNPGLKKFEPDLPLKKSSIKLEKKKNNWAFWYIIIFSILLILLALKLLYVIISYFIR